MTNPKREHLLHRWLAFTRRIVVIFLLTSCSCDGDKSVRPNTDVIFPLHQTEPAWSRGDTLIYRDIGVVCVMSDGAYTTDDSKSGIWVLNVATMARARILSSGAMPALSPHGDSIALIVNRQIAICSLSNPAPVLITSGGSNYFPRWSPTSSTIAFDSDYESPTGANTIWLVEADGSNLRRAADSLRGTNGELRMPDWSPDGGRLVHIRYPGQTNGTSEIYVMNADGTNPVRLTSNLSQEDSPRFSPDGTRIAFSRLDGGQPPQIWVMNADGSGAVQLTTEGGSWPTWSPDGSQIAYVRDNSRRREAGVIWKLNQGGGLVQLTSQWPSQCP